MEVVDMSTAHQVEQRDHRRPVAAVLLTLATAGFGGWMLARADDPIMVAIVAMWILLAVVVTLLSAQYWRPGAENLRWIGVSGLALSVASIAAVFVLAEAEVTNLAAAETGFWQPFAPLMLVFLSMLIAPTVFSRGWHFDK